MSCCPLPLPAEPGLFSEQLLRSAIRRYFQGGDRSATHSAAVEAYHATGRAGGADFRAAATLDILARALGSHAETTGQRLLPEGYVFWLYCCAHQGHMDDLSGSDRGHAEHIRSLDISERLRYCAQLLNHLPARVGPSG